MDPIEIRIEIYKRQAMRKYKKNHYFLSSFFIYSLSVFTCTLFCSSPLWFPSLFSFTKSFLSISIPKMRFFIFNPKWLFIVCNIIIVFLVGESKLVGSSSSSSSSATNIYDEYMKRNQNLQRFSTQEEKKEERKVEICFNEETTQRVHEGGGEEEEEEEEEEEDDLKKRVEDFIAKMNRQRKLEAEQL